MRVQGRARVAAVSIAAALVGLAVPAMASAAITGSVTRLSDGGPVEGAVVTAAGPGQTPVAATTGPEGGFSLDVSGAGPFGVGVQASGLAGQSVAGVGANEALAPIALSPATFDPLPIDVGPSSAIRADATSGVFYSLAMGAPELYRTVDYGGTWQPVTASYEDAESGLDNDVSELLAVSSVSGEVAVASTGRGISYSTDYGTTWRKVESNIPDAPSPRDPYFFWGHAAAGAPSTLLAAKLNDDGSWSVWRADMSAAQPSWVKEPSDPFGAGSRIAQADSRTGSFIGRVSASGELSFAPLTPSGPFEFGPVEVSGLPSPPALLQLGGAKEEAAPPDGALVVGGGTPTAQMLTKTAGASSFDAGSASAATAVPDRCFISAGTVGPQSSVTPTTTGATGAGSLERCWLKKDGAGALTFPAGDGGGVSNRAYDARWGQDNFVAFISKFTFGGANMGPLKYSRMNADGAPRVETELGSGGIDPESGGLTVNGMTSAPVSDTAYGPAGSDQQAVALKTDSIASVDGGQTMTAILPRGSEWSDSVEWWQGASGRWLLFGHAARGCDASGSNMLTALLDWDGSSTLASPNVAGSKCAELGGPTGADFSGGPGYNVTSLEPIPGSDTVFLGLGNIGSTGTHHIYRAALVPGSPPSLSGATNLDALAGVTLSNAPTAMAYCPSIAGDSDVLLVTLGTLYEHGFDVPGGLLRITGATGGSPSATLVDSIPHEGQQSGLADVRADCGSGVVYVGGYDGIAGVHSGADAQTAFFKSIDGGRSFNRITIPDPMLSEIGETTAIGLNPADPNDVKVAAETSGKIAHSADGGATWTLVNDPAVSRSNRVNDIEYPPAGSAPATDAAARGLARAAVGASVSPPLGHVAALGVLSPLVGTSGGAFRGDVTASEGVMAVRSDGGAGSPLGVRVTTLRGDRGPVAVLPATSPQGAAVFQRPNGLAYSSVEDGAWSVPTAVPRTRRGDSLPAAAVDAAGRLYVAFVRKGKRAGTYLSKLSAEGDWSAPRRLSSKRGETLPAIAVDGRRIHVAFVRTRGRERGIWHLVKLGRRWSRPVRVPGSAVVDRRGARGGPSIDAAGGRVHLAYAGAGRAAGVRYSSKSGSRWGRARRLTGGKGDTQPSLALDAKGVPQIVFSARRGLFVLRARNRGKRWSRQRVPATSGRDAAPALAPAGSAMGLAFARDSGAAPGIRYMRSSRKGQWRGRPRRLSSSAADDNPSVQVIPGGDAIVVFERG